MPKNFITLNLSSDAPAPAQSRNDLTLLNLKSDWQTEKFIPQQEFSLVNLPGAFFRRGKISMREALAHELAFRCIAVKALLVQDVIPVLQKLGDDDWQPDIHHPALVALRNPNPDNTFGELMSYITISEDVFGVVYLEKLYSKTGGVTGLAPLDPRVVREIPFPGVSSYPMFWSADGGYKISDIDHYEVTEGARMRRVETDDMIAIKMFDVRSPLAGHSPLFAAFNAISLGNSLNKYIDCYLSAGGPSGLLKIKSRQLSDEEAQQLQDRWYRRYNLHKGDAAGRVAVLDDDGDFEAIGSHLKDLDNENLRMAEQAAICSAFGMPGQLVQAFYAIRFGNQRAGQESVIKQFWENTISPTLTRYRQRLDKSFLIDFDGKRAGISTRVFWDLSDVKGLQEDRDKLSARVRAEYQSGLITINEGRAMLKRSPVPGGDQLGALIKEEQALVALEQSKNPEKGAGTEKSTDDQKKTNPDAPDVKGYDWEGLKLSRKPTDIEKSQIAVIAKAQDQAKAAVLTALESIRMPLYKQGIELLKVTDGSSLPIALDVKHTTQLADAIALAYNLGRDTIQKPISQKNFITQKLLKRILDWLSKALVNSISSRLLAEYARRMMRGLDKETALKEIQELVASESRAHIDELAAGAAMQSVAEARKDEANALGYKRVIYSALLDGNVCQTCKKADGKEAATDADLPDVPNPDCDGRWRCRCVHVYVFDEA